jgi:Protein of unknown function (DUF2630)
MGESPILERIDALVEEQRLSSEATQGPPVQQSHGRLEPIRGELVRCWDVFRRRGAEPKAPAVRLRVPDPPNELDGPVREPPDRESGVHTHEPAPPPDVPRDVP